MVKKMKEKTVRMDAEMEKRLVRESKKTGAPEAEIVRRALQKYLKGKR